MASASMTQEQTQESDEVLATAARMGDHRAFSLLMQRYRPLAFAYANATLHHKEEAEDAVQEAFLRAFQSLPKIRISATWSKWLMQILRNHCIDILRHRKCVQVQPLLESLPDLSDSPEWLALSGERKERLHIALKGLAEKYRVVLLMRYSSGLSYKEIALALDIPESTVTGRVAGGLRILRERFRREGLL